MEKKILSDAEWKAKLTPEQYHVLREAGTERPFTGQFYHNKDEGRYFCAGCGAELLDSAENYDSGSGWPRFTAPNDAEAVRAHVDTKNGMRRVELRSAACDGDWGNVFADGTGVTGRQH